MTVEQQSKELKRDIQRRRKMVEFIGTLGGLLGIVISINPPTNQMLGTLFSFFLVMLIVSAVLAYSSLLFETEWIAYELDVILLSISFSSLLTLALALPLAQILGSSSLSGDSAFTVFGVVTGGFLVMFYFLIGTKLTLSKYKLLRRKAATPKPSE